MSLDSDVNALLKQMHSQDPIAKGTTGELAVTKICENIYQNQGGILYHSYEYKVDKELAGNIKKKEGKLFIENLGSVTEIDVLLVTPFRIFPIEVKSYKANKITLRDDGIYGCAITDKSPVHQNEMHCRHLYSHIFKSMPDGATDYIVPIVCMVDKAEVIDERSDWQKKYIKVCILNTLEDTIIRNNNPGEYRLNLRAIDQSLKDVATNWDKYYPVRA
jgi:hypothetical protein